MEKEWIKPVKCIGKRFWGTAEFVIRRRVLENNIRTLNDRD